MSTDEKHWIEIKVELTNLKADFRSLLDKFTSYSVQISKDVDVQKDSMNCIDQRLSSLEVKDLKREIYNKIVIWFLGALSSVVIIMIQYLLPEIFKEWFG